jgi:ribonucleoside-diphosphate reductase alpha chain
VPKGLLREALTTWDEAYALGAQHGYRNSQVTVLAPTGTIGFMMTATPPASSPTSPSSSTKKLVGAA